MSQDINVTLEMYCEFLNTIPEAALLSDTEGGIVFSNQIAVELFRGSACGLRVKNVRELIPEHLREVHDHHMQRYWDKPIVRVMENADRLKALRQDGEQMFIAISLNQVKLQDGRYVLAICRDMSQEQLQQNQLQNALDRERELATTDPVTGAANRRYLSNELLLEIERSSRHARVFSLAYLDLDNFKDVNDRYGHTQGDEVLQEIVKTAQRRLRKTDLIARIGGDEFAVLLPETDTTTKESPIIDLLREMKRSMREGGWPITISCGVVTFRTPPESAENAIKVADQLMYQVKAAGKDASRSEVYEREDL